MIAGSDGSGFYADHARAAEAAGQRPLTRREWDERHGELRERASSFEFAVDDDEMRVGVGIGLSRGQSTRVSLSASDDHATIGAVYVGMTEDGRMVIRVEAEPELEVVLDPEVVRRPRWRFYDYWRHDPERHDNCLRPESEWPSRG